MDEFTEVSHESWFMRMINSFTNIIVGIILFLGSFVLLFWNEGKAVKRYKILEEGKEKVVSVPADRISPDNNGKLIHITAKLSSHETLKDNIINVSVKNAIKLKRSVLMYQWKERKRRRKHKTFGGSVKRVTTYSYMRTWSEKLINSSRFKHPEKHQNPKSMPIKTKVFLSKNVTADKFRLSLKIIDRLNNYKFLVLNKIPNIKAKITKKKCSLWQGGLYFGYNSRSPQVGDIKISYKVITPCIMSIIGCQKGNEIVPYITKSGGEFLLLKKGKASADKMLKLALNKNKLLTNILRAAGFIIMVIGLSSILSPLSVMMDVIPFLGNITGFMCFVAAVVIAIPLSLITIAVAWLFFRPLIALLLLTISSAVGLLIFAIRQPVN